MIEKFLQRIELALLPKIKILCGKISQLMNRVGLAYRKYVIIGLVLFVASVLFLQVWLSYSKIINMHKDGQPLPMQQTENTASDNSVATTIAGDDSLRATMSAYTKDLQKLDSIKTVFKNLSEKYPELKTYQNE